MRTPFLTVAFCLIANVVPGSAQDCEGIDIDFLSTGLGQEGDLIIDLAYTPNGNEIVVAHAETRNLTVLDEASGAVLRSIDLSGRPQAIALSPSGTFCAVSLIDIDAVAICRLSSGQEESVVPVGPNPVPIRFDEAETKIVVGNTGEDSLSVVDLLTRMEVRRVLGAGFFLTTDANPWAPFQNYSEFELTPDGNTAIVPDLDADRVAFLDLQGGPPAFVTVPKPYAVALSADGATAVTSPHFPETEIAVLDVSGRTLISLRDTGLLPVFTPPIVMLGDATKAWVGTRRGVAAVDLTAATPSMNVVQSEFIRRIALTNDEAFVVLGSVRGHVVDAVTDMVLAEVREGPTAQRLAVSPNSYRAAIVSPGTNDFVELWDTEGALATLDRSIPTGSAPEGDRAKRVVISDDGRVACALNNHSQNVSIIELPDPNAWGVGVSPFVRDIVPAGSFPGEVAISPDGNYAVVSLFGEDQLVIIDTPSPASSRRVQLAFATGPIAISADSTTAYVVEFEDPGVLAGAGVWRIDLATGQTVGSRVSTGEPGGGGYTFGQLSSILISPDGNTLLCCNGGTDDVSVIDLVTWTETVRLALPSYPVRAAFTPDSSRALVVTRNSQLLTEITLTPQGGGLPMITGTAPVGFQPFEVVIDPSGMQAFVAAYGDSSLDIVDLGTLTTSLAAIPLPGASGAQPLGLHMDDSGEFLIVGTRGGDIHIINTTTLQIEQTQAVEATPADVEWSEAQRAVLIASPLDLDGVYFARIFEECGEPFCFGDAGVSPGCTSCPCGNNTSPGSISGCAGATNPSGATLESFGRPRLTDPTLRFEARGLPAATFALLLSGPNALPNAGPCPPGSGLAPPVLDGLRCVGGGTRRLGARQSDPMGRVGTTTPGWEANPALLQGSAAGSTVLYQATYRTDPSLGCQTGLNTTNAVRIAVRP